MNCINKISMIFPVGWTPTSPYLALPLLKGYGQNIKINITISDHNVIFYDWVLSENVINPLLMKIKEKFNCYSEKEQLNINELNDYRKIFKILIYEKYLNEINYWKKRYKNAESPNKHMKISKIIQTALDLVSYYNECKITLNSFDSTVYKLTNPNQLMDFCKHNIFDIFYNENNLLDNITDNLIGISVTSRSQLGAAMTLCKKIKEKDPNKIVYLGGNFITRVFNGNFNDRLLECFFKYVDFVNLYEGETFLDSLKNINKYDEIYNIPNIVYYTDNRIKRNQMKKISYNNFTIPNFDGFSLKLYFTPALVLPLISSKNCYSRCSFCTIPFSSSNIKYFQYNICEIMVAMNKLAEKYHTKYFMFNDEVFNLDRIILLSKLLIDNNKKYRWYCESRFDRRISEIESNIISNGGCKHIQFGLESYNQRVLDRMNKNIKIEDIDFIVNQLILSKISIHLFAIFGFPSETKEEMEQTKKFLLNFIDKARNEHKIVNASIGYGSFALEKDSLVYENPNSYGIRVLENNYDFYYQ